MNATAISDSVISHGATECKPNGAQGASAAGSRVAHAFRPLSPFITTVAPVARPISSQRPPRPRRKIVPPPAARRAIGAERPGQEALTTTAGKASRAPALYRAAAFIRHATASPMALPMLRSISFDHGHAELALISITARRMRRSTIAPTAGSYSGAFVASAISTPLGRRGESRRCCEGYASLMIYRHYQSCFFLAALLRPDEEGAARR